MDAGYTLFINIQESLESKIKKDADFLYKKYIEKNEGEYEKI